MHIPLRLISLSLIISEGLKNSLVSESVRNMSLNLISSILSHQPWNENALLLSSSGPSPQPSHCFIFWLLILKKNTKLGESTNKHNKMKASRSVVQAAQFTQTQQTNHPSKSGRTWWKTEHNGFTRDCNITLSLP